MKVLVIGGGAVGMMQARHLAQLGIEVVLAERATSGKESSWAGGGIISPLYPWRYDDAVSDLASWSQHYYPNLIESLEAESGIDPEFTRHGMLLLDIDDLEQALKWGEQRKVDMQLLDREATLSIEPHLHPDTQQSAWLPHISSVRTPRLAKALRQSLRVNSRVQLLEQSSIVGFESRGGCIKAARSEGGELIEADHFVICAGAWSGTLSSLLELPLKVEPVKGQMIAYQTSGNLMSRVILSKGRYLIPRRDGLVLVGSTLEYTSFDKSIHEEAKADLIESAINMLPSLSKYPVQHHWAGLRPGSPGGVPFIGKLSNFDNIFVNAGHYRNGLVIAPASVNLLTCLLLGETHSFNAAYYEPNRLDPSAKSV